MGWTPAAAKKVGRAQEGRRSPKSRRIPAGAPATRDALKVNFGTPVPAPIPDPTPIPLPGGGGQQNGGPAAAVPEAGRAGTTAPSGGVAAAVSAAIAKAVGQPVGTVPAKKGLATLRFARIQTSSSGRRTLVVRLDGSSIGTVRITMYGKRGSSKIVTVRRVRGNKTVTVSGLKISKKISKIAVKVIG